VILFYFFFLFWQEQVIHISLSLSLQYPHLFVVSTVYRCTLHPDMRHQRHVLSRDTLQHFRALASDLLLNILEVCGEVERGPKLDDAVDALELAEREGAVARRVLLAEELSRRADEAVRRRHDERRHRRPRHP
jgi:hypothetical protein